MALMSRNADREILKYHEARQRCCMAPDIHERALRWWVRYGTGGPLPADPIAAYQASGEFEAWAWQVARGIL